MSYGIERRDGHIAHNHERRGPRLLLTYLIGVLSGIGGFALLAATHEHPTSVEVKPDEALCRERLDVWIYGKDWIAKQPAQQWESFKSQMGDCIR